MNKILLFILALLLISHAGLAQLSVEPLHYRTRINNDSLYFEDNQSIHSGILPLITNNYNRKIGVDKVPIIKRKNSHLRIYPLANLTGGYDLNANNPGAVFNLGAGLGMDYSASKLFLTGKFLPFYANAAYISDSTQRSFDMFPGASRSIANQTYHFSELLIGYKPNKFFTFLGGYGRNFFGEGYRSLLLSDNATGNPFFKIETQFGDIKYVNLYQAWKDNTVDPFDRSLDRPKYAAMHYISWNVTGEFNVSVFETIVWQANDTLVNRGFDPNYLNPIVFYRPVEYGNGSADNVLLGANLSYKIDRSNCLYTQIILDDFLLKEIRARSRWWANKYGFQFGYKSSDFAEVDDLYFQTEINVVRPFTFSHRTSTPSYGHLNASVTHPVGANFWEALNIVSKPIGNFRLTNKMTYSGYGMDTSQTSYGQNIFEPYTNREQEYDHFIMQGLKHNVFINNLTVEMPLLKSVELMAFFSYQMRFATIAQDSYFQQQFQIGIRSRIWNSYTDF
ncbi:MAG: hypothetical protein ACPG21_09070 [Crocinitomicaceae bacterium]